MKFVTDKTWAYRARSRFHSMANGAGRNFHDGINHRTQSNPRLHGTSIRQGKFNSLYRKNAIHMLRDFLQVVVLVIALGMIHGLIILPVVFAALPFSKAEGGHGHGHKGVHKVIIEYSTCKSSHDSNHDALLHYFFPNSTCFHLFECHLTFPFSPAIDSFTGDYVDWS